jgi:hypothetical protein
MIKDIPEVNSPWKGRDHMGRPWHRWEVNIESYLEGKGCERNGMD